MQNSQNNQINENANNVASEERKVSEENPPVTVIRYGQNPPQENTEEQKAKPKKFNYIPILIAIGVAVLIAVIIIIVVLTTKKKKKTENDYKPPLIMILNENNHVKTTMKEEFVVPSDKKIQVVGADYPHKNTTFIIGKNNHSFLIDNNGYIDGVTNDDFPLYYSFNATIINGSYLFKDVKCFKTIDLSKMDSSEMIDASNMFENSEFEEIYFGTENETEQTQQTGSTNTRRNLDEEEGDFLEEDEDEKRKEYFDTRNIKSASNMFMNCHNLKRVQLPPSFNVGKKAKGMFKGCSKLSEVNTSLITSTEIEEMDSMFEDCTSLQEISFSNDFLTGEIRSLVNVFKNLILSLLDISYLRLYNLENLDNVFNGASIKGSLTLGKYYSNDNIRDNLLKEIAKVTDSQTSVYAPSGTSINTVFENIYYQEKNVRISVTTINIDYSIKYKEDEDYKIYSNFLHFGLGWDFDRNNTYDLDSSVVTFDKNLNYLAYVYFSHLIEYDGVIRLNGDDLTGEGEGDDEEINVTLNRLPPDVELFTVQINSFKGNSLKNVKSAYIRLSTDTEEIGTYSVNEAGDNLGLLIGCFYKMSTNNSDEWYFRPLNKVIKGTVVTSSIPSIREILQSMYNNKLMSATEFVNRLKIVANGLSVYSQKEKYNSLYWNGTHWFADCSNLIKAIINGRDVYNPKNKTYQKKFPVVEDVNANGLILKCNNISTDFTELMYGVPRLLHLKDNHGNGHVGIYLGQYLYKENGTVNVIEATTSWKANAVIYSWVDNDGTRRLYQDGPLSEMKYNWTSHGSLDQWVWS